MSIEEKKGKIETDMLRAERYFWPEIAGLSNFKAMLDWEEKQRMNKTLDNNLEGLMDVMKDVIERAYKQGAIDSRDVTPEAIDESYKRGFEDGNAGVLNAQKEVWELAKKLMLPPSEGGWAGHEIRSIFDDQKITEFRVLRTYDVEEAVKRYRNWKGRYMKGKNFDEFAKQYDGSIPIADMRKWLETRQS